MKFIVVLIYLVALIIDNLHLIILTIFAVMFISLFAIFIWPKTRRFFWGGAKSKFDSCNYNDLGEGLDFQQSQGVVQSRGSLMDLSHIHPRIQKKRERDVSYLPAQFVVFDLETTGLDPSRHQIIEIGAICVNRDELEHETFERLVSIEKKIPRRIVELTGITDGMLRTKGVLLGDAMADFSRFVGGLRLVSFNADFDLSFLRVAASQCGIRFDNPSSCALKMARRAWPGLRSYRLMDLAQIGGISLKNPHRAIGDCERALHVYLAAANKLQSS